MCLCGEAGLLLWDTFALLTVPYSQPLVFSPRRMSLYPSLEDLKVDKVMKVSARTTQCRRDRHREITTSVACCGLTTFLWHDGGMRP